MLKKDIKNKSIYFIGISFAIVLMVWVWFPKKDAIQKSVVKIINPEQIPNKQPGESAEIVIKDLILKEVEKHKGLEVVVNASEGKILNSTDKIECKNIYCALNNNYKQIADVHAYNAVINKTNKNVFLTGSTVGHTCDVTITGQDITYNYSNQTLTTNKKTSYCHEFFSLTAQQSVVDLKNSKFTMSGGVTSEISNGPTGNCDVN
jgi:LPS export ABC transporter protein LptC